MTFSEGEIALNFHETGLQLNKSERDFVMIRSGSVFAMLLVFASCTEAKMDESVATGDRDSATTANNSSETSSGGVRPGTEDPLEFCFEVQAELSRHACDLVKQQIAALRPGKAQLTAPEKLLRGETRVAKFSIDGSANEPPISETRTTSDANHNRQRTEFPVKVSRIMTATLSGDGLDVTPEGEQERDLGVSRRASWEWKVTGKDAGNRFLRVTVKAKATGEDKKPLQLDLYEEEKDIKVRVTALMWVQDRLTDFVGLFSSLDGALKGLAAVLVTLGAVFAAWRALRKPKPPAVGGDQV
jgi:hypothetical protein